jgi:hypothetical protein
MDFSLNPSTALRVDNFSFIVILLANHCQGQSWAYSLFFPALTSSFNFLSNQQAIGLTPIFFCPYLPSFDCKRVPSLELFIST